MYLSGTVNLFSTPGWASSQRIGVHFWDIQNILNFGISVPVISSMRIPENTNGTYIIILYIIVSYAVEDFFVLLLMLLLLLFCFVCFYPFLPLFFLCF